MPARTRRVPSAPSGGPRRRRPREAAEAGGGAGAAPGPPSAAFVVVVDASTEHDGRAGVTGRLIERVAAGAQGTAGSDVPPPYGAATSWVIRIAEGVRPRR